MYLPLLNSSDPERPVLWSQGRAVSVRELMGKVYAVAQSLPPGQRLLNLCERRDTFLIAFCAALVRGDTNVLPPSRAQNVVDEVAAANTGSYRCDDEFVLRACETHNKEIEPLSASDCSFQLAADHIAAVGYTSGSTGVPQGHAKRWSCFTSAETLNASRIRECIVGSYGTRRPWIVATVPPQHMYGLETSIVLPLVADMAVHGGRPLFPADIAAALAELPEPRVLITTPVHLRAIAASGQRFPATAVVASATAPLDATLAQSIEHQLETKVLEMFGSTETCVIASRRTSQEEAWRLYPDVTLEPDANTTRVSAPWFEATVPLQDILEPLPDRRFLIRGRNADMVEVAGKRASLSDLTQRLLKLPGVKDAVVFQPDASPSGLVRRVAALVVAPDQTVEALYEQLTLSIDAAFIPRPLLLVPALPRNDVGKLPRERLLTELRKHSAEN
jgi:acyl-coenzyme A synthetase/AMP-(fatty) acid ligase